MEKLLFTAILVLGSNIMLISSFGWQIQSQDTNLNSHSGGFVFRPRSPIVTTYTCIFLSRVFESGQNLILSPHLIIITPLHQPTPHKGPQRVSGLLSTPQSKERSSSSPSIPRFQCLNANFIIIQIGKPFPCGVLGRPYVVVVAPLLRPETVLIVFCTTELFTSNQIILPWPHPVRMPTR